MLGMIRHASAPHSAGLARTGLGHGEPPILPVSSLGSNPKGQRQPVAWGVPRRTGGNHSAKVELLDAKDEQSQPCLTRVSPAPVLRVQLDTELRFLAPWLGESLDEALKPV